MMRADVFALLNVSTSSDYMKGAKDANIIKRSIMKYLESEQNERAEGLGLFQNLKGWNHLLFQKCNRNQVMRTHSVNLPTCVRDEHVPQAAASSSHYVFAAYLEPGLHQIVIYDPLLDEAYCHEFIVELDHH